MILGLIIVVLLAVFVHQYMADTASMNDFTIHIKQVALARIGMTSCDIVVTVNCTNPTNQDLSIASATFDVFIAGSYVGSSSLSHFTIPRRSSKDLTVSLTLLYSNLAHAVLEGIQNKDFILNVTGVAHGYVFFRLFTAFVPFSLSATYS